MKKPRATWKEIVEAFLVVIVVYELANGAYSLMELIFKR